MPAYRSTDFDVHRNWLAITTHLPVDRWYFDDVNGTTVHTLDYPPGFAYFEYFLSNNIVTKWMLDSSILDEQCVALLPDTDNEPSHACVFFQRTTVVLSDMIFWAGAYVASRAMARVPTFQSATKNFHLTFLLIVLNPGMFWLDHVHFQYNGLVMGMLLLSIGCLLRGSQCTGASFHFYYLMGAATFAALLTLKHLFLPLAPWYFVYLLRRYCTIGQHISWIRFIQVALVTILSFILPFLPFLNTMNPREQLLQMLSRLFPFGRGLCHDYWAANVWALYMTADKCFGFISRKVGLPFQGLPTVPPGATAGCLLMGLLPALVCAWKSAAKTVPGKSSTSVVQCVVFCAFSTFMLAYHVHEKAIMTSIVPLTLLAATSEENARLYLRTCALGHFGLLPLLFRPVELPFKVASYVGFLAFAIYGLEQQIDTKGLVTKWDKVGMLVLLAVALFLEVIHPLVFQPLEVLEFLPLMITSVVCAFGLVGCWVQLGLLMVRENNT